jgi:uncharacterized membrane protein YraQ (UPF0718 family)
MKKWQAFLFIFLFSILYAGIHYLIATRYDEQIEKVSVENREMSDEIFQLKKQRDSLFELSSELSTYRTLSLAMNARDEALQNLKLTPGETVIMKRDSSKVLLTDIEIGGTLYNYHITAVVQRWDTVTNEWIIERIDPMLIKR